MQDFTVTGLFAGQHNTSLHGTITDVKFTVVLKNTVVGSKVTF